MTGERARRRPGGRPLRSAGLGLCVGACLLTLGAGAGQAQTLSVRSGEHATFTRLVIRLPEGQDWELGRTSGGYGLRLPGSGVDMDVSQVFERVPRTRLADIRPATEGYDIVITCDCRATGFEDGTGLLVVDIREGAPEPSSRFERPLDGRSIALAPGGMTPPPRPQPPPGPWSSRPPSLPPQAAATRPAPAPPAATYAWTRRFALVDPAASAPSAAEETPPRPAAQQPTEPPGETFLSDMALDLLARQFARAAAQGLVAGGLLDGPEDLQETARGAPLQAPPEPESAGEAQAAGAGESAAAPIPDPLRNLRLDAATARDRLLREALGPTVMADGSACLPDETFAVAAWGDDRPAATQISLRRAGLVGEFDQPDPDAVAGLARLYIHLGFGAEARDLLTGLPAEVADADILRDLAHLVDTPEPRPEARFAGMTGCAGEVALWAVLATPGLSAEMAIDTAAVRRSFSGLPLPLRRHLGPALVQRFLAIGDDDTAQSLRDAIGRAPGDHGPGLGVIDADLAIAAAEPARASATLAQLATGNAPGSAEALALFVEAQLDAGLSIDAATADNVVALAFEHRGTPLGARLSRLEALGLAATERFDAAFAVRDRLADTAEAETTAALTEELLSLLAGAADDAAFLARVFREEAWRGGRMSADLRLGLAGRLLASGFPDAALAALPAAERSNASELKLQAEAHLALGDARAALRAIAGQEGPEAARLRGMALARLGDHRAARAAFDAASEGAAAARSAWLAGDWQAAAERRDGPTAAIASRLADRDPGRPETAAGDPAPETADAIDDTEPSDGPLARAQSLLGQGAEIRQMIDSLIAETALPEAR